MVKLCYSANMKGGVVMDNQETFGQRMKKARKAARIRQQELAKKTHIAVTSISRYENDERVPTIDFAKEIAAVLGVDVNYLLTGQTQAERDAAYIKEKNQSLAERKAITALYEAYGFKYELVEVEGELPYRSDWIITAPDGTQTRFTYDGRLAYGEATGQELKKYALYLHEKMVKELAEADKARKEGAVNVEEETSE